MAGKDSWRLREGDPITPELTAMRQAIEQIGTRARVELSGNMTLARVRELAGTGADDVSIGALTHSAPAADISLEIEVQRAGPPSQPLDDLR